MLVFSHGQWLWSHSSLGHQSRVAHIKFSSVVAMESSPLTVTLTTWAKESGKSHWRRKKQNSTTCTFIVDKSVKKLCLWWWWLIMDICRIFDLAYGVRIWLMRKSCKVYLSPSLCVHIYVFCFFGLGLKCVCGIVFVHL